MPAVLSKSLQTEIVRAENDPNYGLWQGGFAPMEDQILAGHWRGDIVHWVELSMDTAVSSGMDRRVKGVTARPWKVKPDSDRPVDRVAAFLVEDVLRRLLFNRSCEHLLYGALPGTAICELMYDRAPIQLRAAEDPDSPELMRTVNAVVLKDIRPREARRFTFTLNPKRGEAAVDGFGLRLLTRDAPIFGRPLSDRKFIVHTYGSQSSTPWGMGLARKLIYPVTWKKEIIKASLVYADKFAQPGLVGTFDPSKLAPSENADDVVDAIKAYLKSFREGSVAAYPNNIDIKMLEAQRSGTTGVYEWLLAWIDKQISAVILGESYGADANQGLSGAPSKADGDMRTQISKADSDLLTATLNRTVCKWLVEFNRDLLGDANPPTIERSFEPIEDLNARISRDEALNRLGYRLRSDAVRRIYGDDYVDTSEKEQSNPLMSWLTGDEPEVEAEKDPSTKPEESAPSEEDSKRPVTVESNSDNEAEEKNQSLEETKSVDVTPPTQSGGDSPEMSEPNSYRVGYGHINFTPPAIAQESARRAIAADIDNPWLVPADLGDPLAPSHVKTIAQWSPDSPIKTQEDWQENDGYLGDEGRNWSKRIWRQMEAADAASSPAIAMSEGVGIQGNGEITEQGEGKVALPRSIAQRLTKGERSALARAFSPPETPLNMAEPLTVEGDVLDDDEFSFEISERDIRGAIADWMEDPPTKASKNALRGGGDA